MQTRLLYAVFFVALLSSTARAQDFTYEAFPSIPSTRVEPSAFVENLIEACKGAASLNAAAIAEASGTRQWAEAPAPLVPALQKACSDIATGTIDDPDLKALRKLRDDPHILPLFLRPGSHGDFQSASSPAASGLGMFGDPLIRGLAEVMVNRAKEEALIAVRKVIADTLCKNPGDQLFHATCSSVKGLDPERSLASIGTTLRAAARSDLKTAPDAALAYLAFQESKLAEAAYAGRLGFAFVKAARSGRAPLEVFRDISALSERACGDSSCSNIDYEARWASAFVYAVAQTGSNWLPFIQGLIEAPEADQRVAWAAYLLLAEKRVSTYRKAQLVLAMANGIVSQPPTVVLSRIASLEARWASLKDALDNAETEADRVALLAGVTAETIAQVGDTILDHLPTNVEPQRAGLKVAVQTTLVLGDVGASLANQDYGTALVAFNEQVKRLCSVEGSRCSESAIERASDLATLVAEIASAEDSEGVAGTLEAYIAPVGTYEAKYRRTLVTLNGFVGGFVGRESIAEQGVSGTSTAFAGFAPVGVHVTTPFASDWMHFGGFVSIIDLGALTTYRVDRELKPDDAQAGETATASKTPEIGWSQVFSPGAYVTLGVARWPLVIGAGVSFAPELRQVTENEASFEASALRFGAFAAFDVPFYPLN